MLQKTDSQAPNINRTTLIQGALLFGLLALLSSHFVIIQLATGVQFGDAPRNLHWGLLTFENPRFLLDDVDRYERLDGFPPDPPELSAAELWDREFSGFHRWWGPVTPLLFAGVWGVSHSYVILKLVIPIVSGLVVLITFATGRYILNLRAALIAAAFISSYPLFREYGTISYNEALGALLLTTGFMAYLRGWTIATAGIGTLAALTKMDLLAMYTATLGLCLIYDRFIGSRQFTWRHHITALLLPALLAGPWIWIHYLNAGQSAPTRAFSWYIFSFNIPSMLNLVFYLPWYLTLVLLAIIGAVAVAGLRARALPSLTTLLLWTWLGCGFAVLLVYAATPGAGNSPRIIIPVLPALALLFAAGFDQIAPLWRRSIGILLICLCLAVNIALVRFQAERMQQSIYSANPAFVELQNRERGFVLTPIPWETILYARQPATWFEGDPIFEQQIMGNEVHFARYVTIHPIRYVLLQNDDPDVAPGVRNYLDTHAEVINKGAWSLWMLP